MKGEEENLLNSGRIKNHRCFKPEHISKLRLGGACNMRAWMTADVMTEWLHKCDKVMKTHTRKLLMFRDNVTSFSNYYLSEDVKLAFSFTNQY